MSYRFILYNQHILAEYHTYYYTSNGCIGSNHVNSERLFESINCTAQYKIWNTEQYDAKAKVIELINTNEIGKIVHVVDIHDPTKKYKNITLIGLMNIMNPGVFFQPKVKKTKVRCVIV